MVTYTYFRYENYQYASPSILYSPHYNTTPITHNQPKDLHSEHMLIAQLIHPSRGPQTA